VRFQKRRRRFQFETQAKVEDLSHNIARPTIDTEHILLGLIKESSGAVANVLKALGGNLIGMRREVKNFLPAENHHLQLE
jgi:ATP-dependent Clp protease ATP-binding subunit ClpA